MSNGLDRGLPRIGRRHGWGQPGFDCFPQLGFRDPRGMDHQPRHKNRARCSGPNRRRSPRFLPKERNQPCDRQPQPYSCQSLKSHISPRCKRITKLTRPSPNYRVRNNKRRFVVGPFVLEMLSKLVSLGSSNKAITYLGEASAGIRTNPAKGGTKNVAFYYSEGGRIEGRQPEKVREC